MKRQIDRCECCDLEIDRNEYSVLAHEPDTCLGMGRNEEGFYLEAVGDYVAIAWIKYCPMCGRKLTDDNQLGKRFKKLFCGKGGG